MTKAINQCNPTAISHRESPFYRGVHESDCLTGRASQEAVNDRNSAFNQPCLPSYSPYHHIESSLRPYNETVLSKGMVVSISPLGSGFARKLTLNLVSARHGDGNVLVGSGVLVTKV